MPLAASVPRTTVVLAVAPLGAVDGVLVPLLLRAHAVGSITADSETTAESRLRRDAANAGNDNGELMTARMAEWSRGRGANGVRLKSRVLAGRAHGAIAAFSLVALAITGSLQAQQVPDTLFQPVVAAAAYPPGTGPRIGIDEFHHNFHSAVGRYRPFAKLAEGDGFRVLRVREALTEQSLKSIDILLIANPLNAINDGNNWKLPTPSAYTPDEIRAVRAFVERGGALLLIADHMPFAGAAEALGAAFGIRFINGFTQTAARTSIFTLTRGQTLLPHAITNGRSAAERIDSLVVFTGSAFSVTDATPVMRVPIGTRVDQPEEAWVFTEKTPSIPGTGLLFGAALSRGKGRVFASGEAAMFSAQRSGPQGEGRMGFNAPNAPQNAQFALNVLHWLARTP